MIAREILIFVGAIATFCSRVAAYLALFHGQAPLKDILSNAFAALIGLYAGRFVERRLADGR